MGREKEQIVGGIEDSDFIALFSPSYRMSFFSRTKCGNSAKYLNLHSLAYMIGINYSDVPKAVPVHDSCVAS